MNEPSSSHIGDRGQMPLDLTMSTSMLFELLEWGTSVVCVGELDQAYLGTQGDEWDAHKDMALASLGAVIAMGITAALNWRLQRDFAREWAESLRVKPKPRSARTRSPAWRGSRSSRVATLRWKTAFLNVHETAIPAPPIRPLTETAEPDKPGQRGVSLDARRVERFRTLDWPFAGTFWWA